MSADWREIKKDREKYAAYLCGREWSVLKAAVRRRARGMCERCNINEMCSVHHLTYIRKYREHLDDLQAICNQCHEFVHGKSDFDPKAVVYASSDFCLCSKYSRDYCESISGSYQPRETLERSAAVVRARLYAERIKHSRLPPEDEAVLLERLVMARRIANGIKEAADGK